MTIENYIKISVALGDDGDDKTVKDILPLFKEQTYSDVLKLLNRYRELDVKQTTLINRFKIGGVEFGLIPDFDKITTGEYIDLSTYENDVSNVHRLMAILYRPVVSRSLFNKRYSIEEYKGSDEYKDIMLKVDVKVYLSVISFFLTISHALMITLNTSIQKEVGRGERK